MIRVAIIADSSTVGEGLAAVLGAEPDLRIVETMGASEFTEREADVVIWVKSDASWHESVIDPDEGNLDDPSHPPATMILLERRDADAARDAYLAGASAVLVLDDDPSALLAALRAIAAGLIVMDPALSTEPIVPRGLHAASSVMTREPVSLTPREREVLTLLAQGLPNKLIAPRLGITEHTVKTHVAAVYEKLNARNRAEVAIAAARLGLVLL